MKKSLCLVLALAALFLTGTALPLSAEEAASAPTPVARSSNTLPPINLKSSNKGQVNAKNYKGKVTIIDVWASWCGPCRKQIPALHSIKQQYGNRVELLGISVDQTESDHRKAIKKLNINYPSCFAQLEANRYFFETLQQSTGHIRGIPFLIIADRKGKIVYAKSGRLSEKKLQKIIAPLVR